MNRTINREYKDRVFRLLFGDVDNKENILSLYNALNDTHYTNTKDLEINTLEDAIYIHMKNDVSFLIDSYLTMWEQQSTFNPNMPVRGLMYYGELYNGYIARRGLNRYRNSLVKLPKPQYIVFYNGDVNKPPIMKLCLSDAFMHEDDAHEFEWTATMINLNRGKNEKLLEKCKVLSDYMALINKIKCYTKTEATLEQAIDRAIQECIEEGILVEFLRKHRSEVMNSCLTEFDEESYKRCLLEDGREEGRQEGEREFAIRLINAKLAKGMSIPDIAELLEFAEDEVRTLIAM